MSNHWYTSSSCPSGATCVEIALNPVDEHGTMIHAERPRVTRTADGVRVEGIGPSGEVLGVLMYTDEEWESFLAGARKGEFDLPK